MHDVFRNPEQSYGKDELAADGIIYDLDYAPERNEFAYASADKCAYIRTFDTDGTKLKLRAVLQGHEQDVVTVRWNAFHQQWVTGSDDRTVRIWSAEGIPCIKVIHNDGPVSCLCLDQLNGCIITGSSDRVIRVYDPTLSDELVQKNVGHTDAIRSIIHVAARRQYVSASWDQTIRIWNAHVKSGRAACFFSISLTNIIPS